MRRIRIADKDIERDAVGNVVQYKYSKIGHDIQKHRAILCFSHIN